MNGKECQCGKIEVLELRMLPGDRPLRAFVDLEIGSWVIREWRVLKENGRPYRVAPPQISWKAPDRQILYKTVVTIPNELKGQIDFAVLTRFTEEMEKLNGSPT